MPCIEQHIAQQLDSQQISPTLRNAKTSPIPRSYSQFYWQLNYFLPHEYLIVNMNSGYG